MKWPDGFRAKFDSREKHDTGLQIGLGKLTASMMAVAVRAKPVLLGARRRLLVALMIDCRGRVGRLLEERFARYSIHRAAKKDADEEQHCDYPPHAIKAQT